jgi:ferredoxin-NADP reductase/ferredoxin
VTGTAVATAARPVPVTQLMRVAGKTRLADDVVALTLEPADGGPAPAWDAGAHVDLHLPCGLIRQYSLCGDPGQQDRWQVAVFREPAGRGGSDFVHDALEPGTELSVTGPRNHFKLAAADRYLFIAGGIGITPILPMVREASAHGRPWRLVYGGRRRASMAFLGELAAWSDQVTVCPQDECGLLDLDSLLGEPEPGTAVYCCGPEPLLRAVEERCAAWPPGTLHVERFRADGANPPARFRADGANPPAGGQGKDAGANPPAGGQGKDAGGQGKDAGGQGKDAGANPPAGGKGKDAGGQGKDAGGQGKDAGGQGAAGGQEASGPPRDGAFEVELAASGRVVQVPSGVSILAALREAGLDVLSSCEEGTCGTCETGVLDGIPDHRDCVLEPAERDANDLMMICVSRSKTPRLVLEL